MKSIVGFVIGAVIFATSAFGADSAATDKLRPYLQVKPVAGDENIVRGFFSPSCVYSRAYLPFFRNLARTLPASKRFVYTPVINRVDGVSFALAFVAVRNYYPNYLDNFIEASVLGVQDKHISTVSWAGLERIGKAAKLPISLALLVDRHRDELQAEVATLTLLQKELSISNTPAISVAGSYIVTPEFTNGDSSLFSQLVNGVISMTTFE